MNKSPENNVFANEDIPEQRSMTELETLAFLKKNNVEPLSDWKSGQPVLYVLEEVIRGDDGPYGYLPYSARPSIARLDSPTSLDFEDKMEDEDGRVVFPLLNETGGRVDFYAIDPMTEQISFMFIPKPPLESIRGKQKPFHVRKETLFKAVDILFPPSK